MVQKLDTLRTLLESLARRNSEDQDRPGSDAPALAHTFRDCRLELMRLESHKLSETQLHRLQQMDYRLQMVVSGHGLDESIAPEAKRALESFGWQAST